MSSLSFFIFGIVNVELSLYLVLESKYLIFPFNEDPGIIGLFVTVSLITMLSTAPIAEKSPDVPI